MMKRKVDPKTALLLLVFLLSLSVRSATAPAQLTQPRLVARQFAFVLSGDTNKIYAIETSKDLLHWKAIGYPQHPREESLLFSATNPAAYFRARECPAIFASALAVRGLIDLHGSNVRIDSFDSADPAFSTNRGYDATKATAHGNVAAWAGITNSVAVGNVDIYGHVATGPSGTVDIGPTGSIGDEQWHDPRTPNNVRGFQPGSVSDDLTCDFPDAPVPFTSGYTPYLAPGTPPYDYSIGSGNYRVDQISLNSRSLLVTGDAILFVLGDFALDGTAFIQIAPAARLRLYVGGNGSIGGNGVINTNNPAGSFIYEALPSSSSLSIGGNFQFVGCIYAPSTDVTVTSSGNSVSDFVGAIVARNVTLLGHVNFHFDEDLNRLSALF